jgi:hypothetical protein
LSDITSLIWDTNFQSLVLSPLIGAVMGLALTLLFTPPAGHSVYVNIPYTQFITIFNTTIHNRYYGANAKEEAGEALGVFIVSTWLYLKQGQAIIAISTFLSAFIFFASFSFAVKFLIEQPGSGWLLRLSCPMITSAVAYVLCIRSREILDYFIIHGMSLVDALYEGVGILFIVLALYSSTKAVLHQIAFAGLADPSDIFGVRGWLIRHTEKAGGPGGCIRSFGAATFAWLIISGMLIQLVSSFTGR